MKKKVKISLTVIIIILIAIVSYILINDNGWKLRIFKETSIKEFDGKEYIGIASYSNRLRKNIKYYEEYNFFAYKPSEEYIEEFYDYNDYENPEWREYHKVPYAKSIIYYFDKDGNITSIKTHNESGAIVDIEEIDNLDK